MKYCTSCVFYCKNMDVQDAFRNEWNQKTILWVFNRTDTEKIPVNFGCVKYIYFESKYDFFKHIKMCISYMQEYRYSFYNHFQTTGCVSQEICERIMFSDSCEGICDDVHGRNICDTNEFFKNKRNFYMECRTSWLLLCCFYEMLADARVVKLSNIEMIFRDCYLMKMIVKY